ncbi:MAG TPA: prephenate dehydrogenase [Candidatus Hydrogenedentes bacterium]|nr:prephenate dehydrogenase [Candidatus Hydrogenedentota bacterium]
MKEFQVATIVGVGLLGGSLGLALKERGIARTVRGVGRRQNSLDVALARGAIDESFLDLKKAVKDADLIVLCTPANSVVAELDEIHPHCRPDLVVTDVASTKSAICQHARKTWPSPLRFIGSHPMAGSEKYGAEHATGNLYNGSVVIVEKKESFHASDAHRTVCDLWKAVGSKVFELPPEQHDEILARTSHVPHIVAACLALLIDPDCHVRPMIGSGFRDTTRVAAGRAELWRDICLTNPEAIARGLIAFQEKMTRILQLVEERDARGLETFFEQAQENRKRVLDK